MATDGSIDYRSFSRAQLVEALRNIDATRYPINYANLCQELDGRAVESHSADGRVASAISMKRYVLFAAVGMLGSLALAAIATLSFGLKGAPVAFAVGAAASILVSAWLFHKKHGRPLLARELRRLFAGCFCVFWFIDAVMLLPLTFPIAVEQRGLAVALIEKVAGALVDLGLVAVVVFVVVPWMLRLAHASSSPNITLERTREP